MDRLWSPWRYQYITSAAPDDTCIFCTFAAEDRDAENLIVYRGRLDFVILNRFPYTSGHLMIVPYAHAASLMDLPEETAADMMLLARRAEGHLREIYRPEGLNLGLNIGRCAGAGIAGHVHMHVLPRWIGDANFMSTVGETRVMPEDLATTYEKLSRAFGTPASGQQ